MDRPKEYQSLLPQNEADPVGSETREIGLASPAPRSVQFVMFESGNNPAAGGNEKQPLIVDRFDLHQNYPNPFNPQKAEGRETCNGVDQVMCLNKRKNVALYIFES